MSGSSTVGVHTYSVGMVVTHKQFKKIWGACHQTGRIEDHSDIIRKVEKLYCYVYMEQGLKIYLSSKPGKLYRLRIQVEPSRVLGEQDPTALFQPSKKTYREMVKTADKLLERLKVPRSIDSMKISRCDLTCNIEFTSQKLLMEYLRIIQKGKVIPHYEHIFFQKNGGKVRDWKETNAHSHCLSCKSASFLVYDKIAQLQMIDRDSQILIDRHVLRIEAELKRPALKKHLGKRAVGANRELLMTAAQKAPKVIDWYLSQILPCDGVYLRYKDAVDRIEHAKLKSKTQDRMLYLLRKTSDRDSLSTALDDLREKYHLSKSQCSTTLRNLRKLEISPITLRNDSKIVELPSLRAYISGKNLPK